MEKIQDRHYNLAKRTADFGKITIEFLVSIPRDAITIPMITQLVKSSTSIGANYSEADNVESGKDFKHKIGICKKESKEAAYFLEMFKEVFPNKRIKLEVLKREALGLNLIFNAIYIKVDKKHLI